VEGPDPGLTRADLVVPGVGARRAGRPRAGAARVVRRRSYPGCVKPLARAATLLTVAAPLAWIVRAAWGVPTSMGASRRTIRPYVAASPRFRDGDFHNTVPASMVTAGQSGSLLREAFTHRGRGRPTHSVPLSALRPTGAAAELAVTWFGHASALLEVDGARVLVDPVWGERVSPSRVVGPRRLHPVPGPLEGLPPVDAVLVSHDHYDHLDLPTVRTLLRTQTAPFVVPLGIGAHLRRWGVPESRIVELDWDGVHTVAGLTLTCTEARHFSGRGIGNNPTLWSSWVVAGPRHRVFFGGDTGYTPAFQRIGARHGPFDLSLLPVGAYGKQWPDVHMDPEEAVRAQQDLNAQDLDGGLLLPIHWATFNLAFHAWAEPVQRLLAAAGTAGVRVVVPQPGQRVDAAALPEPADWWSAAI
jgi:L-ascorbate metabolism protein UlaG (beta-lactamase superfamily)